MLQFILNDQTIKTDAPEGMTVLDFVRYQKHLTGTKIGCREGDCGACTVLIGTYANQVVTYQSMTSCLLPLANIQGKHLVTVEGINKNEPFIASNEAKSNSLTPVQQFLVEESGTQCGFCTVGFVMSMTGLSLQNQVHTEGSSIAAIDGNICRCTGYKSIERAAKRLTDFLNKKQEDASPLAYAIENQLVPTYFDTIKDRLSALKPVPKVANFDNTHPVVNVGGGTDLYVQQHDNMSHIAAKHLFDDAVLRGIKLENQGFYIGASTTVSDLKASAELNKAFPSLQKHLKLVSSTPIRNMATLAGNLVNASPIADMTVLLLALNASIILQNQEGLVREILLKDFYKGYKILDKTADEILTTIRFPQPEGNYYLNFEKVCKRTHLDIASVNSAILVKTNNNIITEAHIAVGGVAPIPLFLPKNVRFLQKSAIY